MKKNKAIGLIRVPEWPLEWPLEGSNRQAEVITEYALANGYELASEWIDLSSEATVGRIKALLPEGITTILLHDISRLGRVIEHVLLTLKKLHDQGIRVISITDGIDTGQNGRLLDQLLYMAEVTSSLKAESTREGRIKSQKTGKKLGRPKTTARQKRKRGSSKLDSLHGVIVQALMKGDSIRKISRDKNVPYGTLHHYIKSRALEKQALRNIEEQGQW